jgi:hypothetical protein
MRRQVHFPLATGDPPEEKLHALWAGYYQKSIVRFTSYQRVNGNYLSLTPEDINFTAKRLLVLAPQACLAIA